MNLAVGSLFDDTRDTYAHDCVPYAGQRWLQFVCVSVSHDRLQLLLSLFSFLWLGVSSEKDIGFPNFPRDAKSAISRLANEWFALLARLPFFYSSLHFEKRVWNVENRLWIMPMIRAGTTRNNDVPCLRCGWTRAKESRGSVGGREVVSEGGGEWGEK